ncbi:conserved hypothetical protein [Pediculus humanus corporis]|uniref:HTH CENPB-type domain-containing protein n=1 Tax=Pediculus humanus subsp. corporis TaxID=121224 RepID=E0VUL4_PEDHC|nr:uncharacterized protein Phum_PHUM451900 [Pediculus humanus corporis]EEB17070.1 conserved hypothetical protein [Pediculus humanus corporis]
MSYSRGKFRMDKLRTGLKQNKKKRITIEKKKEVVKNYESGVSVTDLSKLFGIAKSTISTILRKKDAIKTADVATGITVITKQRPKMLDEVEKSLIKWIEENKTCKNTTSDAAVCEKARQLYKDLLKGKLESTENHKEFKASRGWFKKFKKRTGLLIKPDYNKIQLENSNDDLFETDDVVIKSENVFFNWDIDIDGGTATTTTTATATMTMTRNEIFKENNSFVYENNNNNDYVRYANTSTGIKKDEPKRLLKYKRKKITPYSIVVKDMLNKWNDLEKFTREFHPDKDLAGKTINVFNVNVMSHFARILQKRKQSPASNSINVINSINVERKIVNKSE